MSRRMGKLAGTAALAGVLASWAGVGAGASAPGDSTTTDYTGVHVLVLYPYLGDQSYVREYNASTAALAAFPGATIDIKAGPSRTNVDFFLQEIGNAVDEGYSVIAINTGGTAQQLVNALNTATEDGIKVISFDGAPPEIDDLTSVINYDNFAASGVAGGEFLSLLPDGGEIGVIRCLEGLPDTDAFIDGFMDAIDGSNLEVVATGDAECDPEKSRTIAEDMLSTHPDLVGIYDSVDVSAQGSLQAIEAAGSDAILGSIGGQQYALEAIAGGSTTWRFTVPYPFEVIGTTAVETAVAAAQGDDVETEILIPAQPIVTSENASEALATVNASIGDSSTSSSTA